MTFYIGVGSNLKIEESLTKAADLIASLFQDLRCSRVYRTAPIGRPEQPDYINAVWSGQRDCEPEHLKIRLKEIESQCGRKRDPRDKFAARTMDLDLLGWNGYFVEEEEILERSFLASGLGDLDSSLMKRFPLRAGVDQFIIEPKLKKMIESRWIKENANHESP